MLRILLLFFTASNAVSRKGSCAVIGFIMLLLPLTGITREDGEFHITDEFVEHIKSATNPDRFGLREDGRFYPYSSPDGRRIGYRQTVASKDWFLEGWSKEEAEQQLRLELEETARRLEPALLRDYNLRFERLSRESQEILVEFGHSEGVDNLSETLVRAAAETDWETLLVPAVYSRNEADWPDIYRNRAFVTRWGPKGGIR